MRARDLARAAAVGVLVAVGGLWLGRAVAATGWSAVDAVFLGVFAVPTSVRSFPPLLGGTLLFAAACALGYYPAPHVDAWRDSMTTTDVFGVASLLATARALAELKFLRAEAR